MFSYLWDKFGSIWLHDSMWSQTKCYVHWKVRLFPEHEVVGAEPCSGILGAIVSMNQHSNVVLPL